MSTTFGAIRFKRAASERENLAAIRVEPSVINHAWIPIQLN